MVFLHFDSTLDDESSRFRIFPVDFSNFSFDLATGSTPRGEVKKSENKRIFSDTGPVRDGRSIRATKTVEHENQNDKRVKNTRVFLLRRRVYDCVFPNDPFFPLRTENARTHKSTKIDRRSGGAPRARTLLPSVRPRSFVGAPLTFSRNLPAPPACRHEHCEKNGISAVNHHRSPQWWRVQSHSKLGTRFYGLDENDLLSDVFKAFERPYLGAYLRG